MTARHVTRWGGDPFSLGSYSFLPVGAEPSDREELARAVGGAVFFCGEAAHGLYPSTVSVFFIPGQEMCRQFFAFSGPLVASSSSRLDPPRDSGQNAPRDGSRGRLLTPGPYRSGASKKLIRWGDSRPAC